MPIGIGGGLHVFDRLRKWEIKLHKYILSNKYYLKVLSPIRVAYQLLNIFQVRASLWLGQRHVKELMISFQAAYYDKKRRCSRVEKHDFILISVSGKMNITSLCWRAVWGLLPVGTAECAASFSFISEGWHNHLPVLHFNISAQFLHWYLLVSWHLHVASMQYGGASVSILYE